MRAPPRSCRTLAAARSRRRSCVFRSGEPRTPAVRRRSRRCPRSPPTRTATLQRSHRRAWRRERRCSSGSAGRLLTPPPRGPPDRRGWPRPALRISRDATPRSHWRLFSWFTSDRAAPMASRVGCSCLDHADQAGALAARRPSRRAVAPMARPIVGGVAEGIGRALAHPSSRIRWSRAGPSTWSRVRHADRREVSRGSNGGWMGEVPLRFGRLLTARGGNPNTGWTFTAPASAYSPDRRECVPSGRRTMSSLGARALRSDAPYIGPHLCDAEPLYARLERGSLDPEHRGGTAGTANHPVARLQRAQHGCVLDI